MQVIPRFVARLGVGLALAMGPGVCAVAQEQGLVGSHLRLDAQVVGPSSSPTLHSTHDLSGGDVVQWFHYFASRVRAPWTADAEQVLPAGFTWQGQLRTPPDTAVRWRVRNTWVTNEPAIGTVVSALAWRMPPMLKIDFASTPKSVNFKGTGDGFRVISYKQNFYVVNHHALFDPEKPDTSARPLNCRTALKGETCAGFPSDGTGLAFVDTPGTRLGTTSTYRSFTPHHAMEALNLETGELFVGVDTPSGTQVVCTKLDTLRSCGAFQLGKATPFDAERHVNLETIGSKYFVLDAAGTLHCYDIDTKGRCGTTAYRLAAPAIGPIMLDYTSTQLSGKLFFSSRDAMYCHDPETGRPCAGWENYGKNNIAYAGDTALKGGAVPVPDALGVPRGVCGTNAAFCYAPDGTRFHLSDAAVAFVRNNSGWIGTTYRSATYSSNFNAVLGSRIYMLPKDGVGVSCFDFATDAACPGFPIRPAIRDMPYSTRFDPIRPDCLLTLGHAAIAYTINVNTLGSCSDPGEATDRKTLKVDPAEHYRCDAASARVTGWGSVRLSPTVAWGGPKGLSQVRVTLRDGNGALLPAAHRPNRSFDAGLYSLDISDVPYPTYPRLTVDFQMLSGGSLHSDTSVGVDVTWTGPPRQLCFRTRAPDPVECETTSTLTATTAFATAPDTPLETIVADKALWSGVGSEGYAAAAAATSTRALTSSLSSAESRTYLLQGRYDLKTFSGDVWALALESSQQLGVDALVKASSGLSAASAPTRPMYLARPVGNSGRVSTVPLDASRSSQSQRDALNLGLSGAADDKGVARLEYLRGVDGSAGFRPRAGGVLGPVINSAPAVIPTRAIAGLPEANHPGYAEFRRSVGRPHPMVVWGGNDGAVHAAEVKSGELVGAWSLVPDVMLRKAAQFSDPTLPGIRLNPYFVDNVPMVGHARTGSGWKTLAVVTFGRGARAITAIDVTRTDLSEGAGVLFEYTNETHPDLRDLGYIVSSPISSEALGSHQIVKLADNRWAVLVGNGVDSNDQSSGLAASGPGRPVLYAFYVDDAEPRWRRFAVDELLGVNGDAALSTRNGLSTPRPVDVDGDGRVDIAYAGDIRGNLWRFDLKSLAAPAVSRLYAAGAERPIHGAPLVVRNGRSGACPVSQGNRCWQVIVGTGAYLSPLRGTSNAAVQRIVSILDLGDGSTTEDSALVTLPYESLTGAAGVEFRFSAGSDLDYTSGKRGWRIALARREHTVSAPLLLPNAQLRLSTVRPTGGPSAGGQCQPARSWVFQADPAAGPPSADSFDFNNDGMIDAQDRMATGGSDIKRPPLAMAVSGAQFATPGLLLARKVAANSAYLVFPSLNIDTGTNTGGAAGTNVPAVGRAPSPAAGGLARVGDRKTLGRVSWRKAQ